MSSLATGEDVPIPRKPAVDRVSVDVAVCVSVLEKYANCPVVPVIDCPPTHVPFTEKQPVVMLKPTSLVEVADPVMFSPVSVVVPKPVPAMENGTLAVCVSASEVVPMLNTPPVDWANQCFRFAPADVSVIVSLDVAPAMCSFEFGVVVPMPTLPSTRSPSAGAAGKLPAYDEPITAPPATSSKFRAFVVPMPKFPFSLRRTFSEPSILNVRSGGPAAPISQY